MKVRWRIFFSFVFILIAQYTFCQSREQVYSGIILHIMKYMEWPSVSDSSAMVVGVVNDAPLTIALNKAAFEKKIHFKNVEIVKYSDIKNIKNCQVLFIPKKVSGKIPELIAFSKKENVLIITEEKPSGVSGASINFVEVKGKLTFELYVSTVNSIGLKISEQLTKYAIVKD